MQTGSDFDGFHRHITSCRNAVLPGSRIPFRVGAVQVGWVAPELADALIGFAEITRGTNGVCLLEPGRLEAINRALSIAGHFRWRSEAFDVRADPHGPVLARLDRGALPAFGVASVGVHVNGLVRRSDGLHVWIARRAADKALDPNKLDHIVAGGVPAGLSPWQTLIKEAGEEAGIPPALAGLAHPVGILSYEMERPEGLRRDRLHCYDLELPESFTPHPADGEVQEFFLWPLSRVAEAVATSDDFKFNVNLVLIDLLLRHGLLTFPALRAALDAE